MINTNQQLEILCKGLNNQAWFAIDTEFVRERTYYAELSLIQICDQQSQLALIDPLAELDLSHFWQVLANPNICKIFHSARQDIEVLFQRSNQMPQNIFDTQIAGNFSEVGEMAGLARTIETRLGHILPKQQTRTNWYQRPLSAAQIEYALDDVRYLPSLYQKILQELEPQQLQTVIQQSKQLLNPNLYHVLPDQAWLRIKGRKKLKARGKTILQALAAWRETLAQQQNLPRPWVLPDFALCEIAKKGCETNDCLLKIAEIKPATLRKYSAQILQLVSAAKKSYQAQQLALTSEEATLEDD